MATIDWASDSDEESSSTLIANVDESRSGRPLQPRIDSQETPRKLNSEEIDGIVNGIRFGVTHNPVQENIIGIHREKTRKKLGEIKILATKIPELKKFILQQFYSSIIAYGEAVGVNAAQCIGEPTTQLTLNSVAPHERLIILHPEGETELVEIGAWIDGILACASHITHIPENRTEYVKLDKPVLTPTPSNHGRICWDQITGVTRHLPVGDMVKITSRSGRSVTVTQSKSLLVYKDDELVQVCGADVKLGDLVPIIYQFPNLHAGLRPRKRRSAAYGRREDVSQSPIDDVLGVEFGRIVGLYIACGWITDTSVGIIITNPTLLQVVESWCEEHNITTKTTRLHIKIFSKELVEELRSLGTATSGKKIPVNAYTGPLEFAKGILDGYFAGKGTVDRRDKRLVVSSASEDIVTGIAVLCSRFGIVGDLRTGGTRHTFAIYGYNARVWVNVIGSSHPEKAEQMKSVTFGPDDTMRWGDVILDPITKIETVPPSQFVYDLTVPATTNFTIWNGLCVADTFHSAGISAKNVTLGFPRASELFNATKSPSNPMCTIYFTRDNKTPQQLHKVCDKFSEATVEDLLVEWHVFEPDDYFLENWHTAWFKLRTDFGELTGDDWCLRLCFDVFKLYEHNVTIKHIVKRLMNTYSDIRCIPSPLNIGIIDVLVNCVNIEIDGARSQELVEISDIYEARHFYMTKIVSPKLRGQMVCGISGITKTYRRKAKINESFGEIPLKKEIADRLGDDEEWIVDTDGTNLSELLSQPGVDSYRTMSNDMWEILTILGIEAARQYLYLEFMNIVSNGGISINPVHIQVLVDKMTYTGGIRSIARFGVETAQYDPIARATFEQVMNQIITSAKFSERDNLNGISSNIVLGTKINAGTGRIEFEDIPLRVVPSERTEMIVTTAGKVKIRPPTQTFVSGDI